MVAFVILRPGAERLWCLRATTVFTRYLWRGGFCDTKEIGAGEGWSTGLASAVGGNYPPGVLSEFILHAIGLFPHHLTMPRSTSGGPYDGHIS